MYTRLYKFLTSNGILNDKQFGFREGHSTSHALNFSIEHIREKLRLKHHVIAVFIDLSKAFDTLDHNILLEKLESYGIRGVANDLLRSYLTNRNQYTSALGESSGLNPIIYGVPQGSCLGPLLFLIYINDLCNSSDLGEFVLFADDTNIFVSDPCENMAYQKANNILKCVQSYMHVNKLHINASKSCYMQFKPTRIKGSQSQNHSVRIGNNTLEKVSTTKFLGVIIDEELSWVPHINDLSKRLKYHIGSIKRIKQNIPSTLHKSIYHTLFESHLHYGITVWGGVSKSKLDPLFKAQKKCLRILFGDEEAYLNKFKTCARTRPIESMNLGKEFFKKEESKPLFNSNEILTVHNAYIYHMILTTFKILKYTKFEIGIIFVAM